MQPSSTDFSPKYDSDCLSHRRQSTPHHNEKNTLSMLLTGHSLTPWKSADSLVPRTHDTPTASNHQLMDRSRRISSACLAHTARDSFPLYPDNSTSSGLTDRLRKVSFSRQPTAQAFKKPQDVVMTNTINKDYDPATGNKVINKYMIIREIGRGVHGKVKLAEDIQTGELVAIKIVDKRTRRRQLGYSLLRGNSQQHVRSGLDGLKKAADLPQYRENEQKIRREIAILKKCAHPHVVRLREVIDDPASRKIYMALEYMEGGEIEWRDENEMPVLSLQEARSVFRDVVSGLDYLHYQGIIHRDIKPANLLLTNDLVVKISDFGVSYFNEVLAGDGQHTSEESCSRVDRELAETAGTPAFFAPELCCAGDMPLSPGSSSVDSRGSSSSVNNNNNNSHDKVSHRPKITKAIDVWALGVTLYCFIFGRCPFTAQTEFELFDTIPSEPLTFPDESDVHFTISDDLKHLLHRLLTKNPEERITLEEVKHHPWVIADLNDPQSWWEEADPRRYKAVEVTEEEVTHAVTIMDRLRKSIQKLSSSLSNLTHGITRRRSKSVTSNIAIPRHPPALPTDTLHNTKPSYSTSILSPASRQPLPLPPPPRPVSCLSDDDAPYHRNSEMYLEDQDEHDMYEEGPTAAHHPYRPSLDRQASSASSSSGLAITISRYRGGLTPQVPPSSYHPPSQK